jgi:hypothetical protein
VETGTGIFVSASDTGSDPLDPDSDGDGISDGDEVAAGSDPNDANDPGVPRIPALPLLPTALLALALAWGARRARSPR